MRLYSFLALLRAPLLVCARPNPFKIPSGGLSATGDRPLTLEWTPTTSGPITLVLRSGNAKDLSEGTVIASSISNSGSYTWTPSNSLTSGSDYAIEIVDDSDPSQTNYTPHFTLTTTTTKAYTTKDVELTLSKSPLRSKAPGSIQTGPVPTPSSLSSSYTLSLHNPFSHKTFTSLNTSSTSGLTVITHSAASTTPTGARMSSTMPASTASAGGAARATAFAMGIVGVALGAWAL